MPVSPSSPRVAILSAARSPIGRYLGSLRGIPAPLLGAHVARAAIQRAGLEPSAVEEVLVGHGIAAGVGQNPARQVGRHAGVPDTAGATTVHMVCGSGMKAVHLAVAEIRSGAAAIVLAGGMESMSRAPYLVPGEVRWGTHFGDRTLEDAMQVDSLRDAYDEHELMGRTGERVARKFGLRREEVDAYAVRSNRRAADAATRGLFAEELVPVPAGLVAGSPGLAADECVRPGTSMESLARLPPAFEPGGVLTAGNSSKLSDGAAMLVLASEREVSRRGLAPIGWIHSTAVSGVAPADVMEAPIPTVREHLAAAGWAVSSLDGVEHNEAYASASLAVQRAFGFPDEIFNPRGGAVALGHPIGASGARILVTLLFALRQTRGRRGLATLCMGGGNGLSTLVELA
ncbi:MAG: thiolase family protein [Thermoplasmata archaeon]